MDRRAFLASTAALLASEQAHAFGLGQLGGGFGSLGGAGKPMSPINLLQHSESFDLWTPAGITVTTNVSGTADRLAETATLTQHSLTAANINFVSGVMYTFSLEMDYENSAFIQLLFGSAAFGANAWGNLDFQSAVAGTLGSAATAGPFVVNPGGFRGSITATATATAAAPVVIFGANVSTMTRAASYTGVVSNTRLFVNAQVNTGSTALPYVPVA